MRCDGLARGYARIESGVSPSLLQWRSTPERNLEMTIYDQARTIDILDLCGRHGIELKGSGDRRTALCPLPGHNEKTESFTVYVKTNSFYCFGCSTGGDVITLHRLLKGLPDNGSAANELCQMYGLPTDGYTTRTAKNQREKKKKLHEELTKCAVGTASALKFKAEQAVEDEVAAKIRENAEMVSASMLDFNEEDPDAGIRLMETALRIVGNGESVDDIEKQYDPDYTPASSPVRKKHIPVAANHFDGKPTRFVWYPFLPCGEYSVMAAAGGSGKGMCAALIAAYLSKGYDLPEDVKIPDNLRAFPYREPQNVLFISSEDTGNQISSRLRVSNADLNRVLIIPKEDSAGMDLSADGGLDELRELITGNSVRLTIIDPVQAFIGIDTNMNMTAKMRGILSGISKIAEETDSAVLLIAHTNKRGQETDLNSGILGSVETVNAARSVMYIMRDPEDENPFTSNRLILHTKSNHARLARSVRFEIAEKERDINGEKVKEAGGRFCEYSRLYSDVTKELWEEATRRRVSARELLAMKKQEESKFDDLISLLKEKAEELRRDNKPSEQYPYSEFDSFVWSGKRPADAIGAVMYKLLGDGIIVKPGVLIHRNGSQAKGLKITLKK